MVLHQQKYVKEMLKRFKMASSNSASSPVEPNLIQEKHEDEDKVNVTFFKQIVESLRYVCNNIPNIGFSVGMVTRYMDEARVTQMKAARRILRFLKGSLSCGIPFP